MQHKQIIPRLPIAPNRAKIMSRAQGENLLKVKLVKWTRKPFIAQWY